MCDWYRARLPQAEPVDTGINWEAVKAELSTEEFVTDEEYGADDDTKLRSLYLGSCLSLCPSGKFYTPWAHSNVDVCSTCNGSGTVLRITPLDKLQNRLTGKGWWWRPQKLRPLEPGEKYLGNGAYADAEGKVWYGQDRENWEQRQCPRWLWPAIYGLHLLFDGYWFADRACPTCNGQGSTDADQDERYRELMEAEAEEHGYSMQWGSEGDGCDVFIVEYA